jgi:glycosyltransferase involved in cell wall biosynthesis
VERSAQGRAFVALSRTNYLAVSPDAHHRARAAWPGEIDILDRTTRESRLRAIARLVRHARRYAAVVLDGSVGLRKGYVDLLAAAIIGRTRSGPVVVIGDCTWKRGANWLDRLACRIGIRLVDSPRVSYCVLSTDEVSIFPRTWGVDPERVSFTPWPYVVSHEHLDAAPVRERTVFAGGDSMRDYAPLLEAARGLDAEVTIATRHPDVAEMGAAPENVRIGPVSRAEYVELMRGARAVVVPLRPTVERSAGQTTYANAMAMGRLVIVTDVLGVRDYVDDGLTGLIVPPSDAPALRRALSWAVDPGNRAAADRIAARAREFALERLSPDEYVANLLRVARRSLERAAHG